MVIVPYIYYLENTTFNPFAPVSSTGQALSLSKGRSMFERLTTNGFKLTLTRFRLTMNGIVTYPIFILFGSGHKPE